MVARTAGGEKPKWLVEASTVSTFKRTKDETIEWQRDVIDGLRRDLRELSIVFTIVMITLILVLLR